MQNEIEYYVSYDYFMIIIIKNTKCDYFTISLLNSIILQYFKNRVNFVLRIFVTYNSCYNSLWLKNIKLKIQVVLHDMKLIIDFEIILLFYNLFWSFFKIVDTFKTWRIFDYYKILELTLEWHANIIKLCLVIGSKY